MKQIIYIIISFFLLISCKTPDYLPKKTKIGEVEYFDFQDFEKNKSKEFKDEYYKLKEDTLEVLKLKKSSYLYESFTVYPKNYKLIKRYYPNGIIKERGKEYYSSESDNFKIGKWEYFDEQGNLIKVEDKDGKDREYDMTYKEAFRRVAWHFGFSKKGVWIQKFIGDKKLHWVFTKNGKSRAVEMETGKVKKVSVSMKM